MQEFCEFRRRPSLFNACTSARGSRPRLVSLLGLGSLWLAACAAQGQTDFTFLTLAGPPGGAGFVDGTGSDARFSGPFGIAVDTLGNVYVADTYNNAIRTITPAGEVKTLAGGSYGGHDGAGSAGWDVNLRNANTEGRYSTNARILGRPSHRL